MEENKIGRFIRDRRLELCLTQQQLADKLGVTDKAVSKWERSVSYPDITILRELAAALEVSVTELLAGERDESPPVPLEVEDMVVDTVAYAETVRRKNGGWHWWAFIAVSAGCAVAALVLVICALACDSRGCLCAAKCVAFGWAVCYPLLRTERPVRNALIIASIGIYPFLLSLGVLSWPYQTCIVAVSVAYAWAVYRIWMNYRKDMRKITFLTVLLGVVLHISINLLYDKGYEPDFRRQIYLIAITTAATLALDALCLLGARALEKIPIRMKQ